MSQQSHRVVGVIRIEPSIMEISGGQDDDSTIGGLLARFAQRSLLADGSGHPWWFRASPRLRFLEATATEPMVHANLNRLVKDLEQEFSLLSDVVA